MVEYEYSYKVKDINPFIEYCKEKNYSKEKENLQTRILYHNDNNMLARITKTEIGEEIYTEFNLKDEGDLENNLNICRESPMLVLDNSNKEFIESMLEMLDFKKFKTLKRKRYVFVKEDVKFEIDDYIEPDMKVLAIEGEKSSVDKIYYELENTINKLKVK